MGKHPTDVAEIDAVEREVDALRQRTEGLIVELERRVARVQSGLHRAREIADVRAHPRAAAGVGAGTLVAMGVGIWILTRRRADNRRLVRRIGRRAGAYRALLAHPERAVAPRGPSLSKRLLTAVVIAAATTFTKRLLAGQMR